MNLKIFQVDAFTSKAFGGNPAAVVPLDGWLADDVMLRIAAENNLSETAFFVKEGDRYHIRWFTPTTEVNLCGHATLATSHVIFNELKLEDAFIEFHSDRSGELGVEKHGDKLVLDFPSYPIEEIEPLPEIALALGMVPLRTWETQGNMVVTLFQYERDITAITPDMSALAKLPYDEVIVTARGDTSDFVSRMFAPRIGIPEDPVTGAIHCSLIPYWAGELGKTELFARQVSSRGGEIFCELAGDRVKIGGNAVTFLKGEIYVGAGSEKAQALEIRLATPDDAAAIAKVLRDAFTVYREVYTEEAFEVVTPGTDAILGRFEEGPMWVAEMDGEVVGTVSLTTEPEGLYLRSMAVSPEAQGRGIGHRLLHAVDEFAESTELERIFLYTTYFVPGAKEMYAKHGYEWVRDTSAEEWYGTPGLEMDKKIA